ncbi:hypothetical protein FIBSPDRAFT_394588 [Athelia psychrophila]|uniref:Uncharacterized protein n=1 Tax=Athelia psychrophila TaxID=1759441 RepID=A0A166NMB4_9AGAM|nr:hypothetical protein FIBSPDRAFT_394588 [Fibularhizoctonia sp. CBS 109695]
MASASYAYLPESYEITIVEATGLRPYRVQKRKFSSTHFQINAGSLSWTTPRVQWQDNGIVRCNYTIVM